MLQLKAVESIEVIDEFDGEKGLFVKTFALNTKRNKNGWAVPNWPDIVRNMPKFKSKPGIEYVKCENEKCDLDHTDGATELMSLKVQENFRVSTIIDYQLDEKTKTAYAIHKVHDVGVFEKIKAGEILAVSPSIWPNDVEVTGKMPNGLPKIDVYDFNALHIAFVNKPAFGDDANITAVCEGENCPMKLLTATTYGPDTEGLAPLKQVPIVIRHNDKLRFVSVTEEVANEIDRRAQIDESFVLNEETFKMIMNEFVDTSLEASNNSFKTCTCKAKREQTMSDQKNAKATEEEKVKDLESRLKAAEEEKKDLESKLKATTEELEKEKQSKSAMDEDKKEEAKAKKAAEDEEKKEAKAKVARLEAKVAQPMVEKLVALYASETRPAEDLVKEYSEMSLDAIEKEYNKNQSLIEKLVASEQKTDEIGLQFPFSANELGSGAPSGALSAKSLEDMFEEVSA